MKKEDEEILEVLRKQHQDDMRVMAKKEGYIEGFKDGTKDGEAAKWVFAVMLLMGAISTLAAFFVGKITTICPI